jgi:hypothetical protein
LFVVVVVAVVALCLTPCKTHSAMVFLITTKTMHGSNIILPTDQLQREGKREKS